MCSALGMGRHRPLRFPLRSLARSLLLALHFAACRGARKGAEEFKDSPNTEPHVVGPITLDARAPRIPKIIHIKPVPNKRSYDKFRSDLIEKWKEMNPAYEVKLWDDDECRDMIEKNFPWYITLYDSVETPVERADIWKYFVMYLYGGVYADDDVEPRVPVDEWHVPFLARNKTWNPVKLMLGLEYVTAKPQEWPIFVNAVMYSQPRIPLFMNVIDIIEQRCLKEDKLGAKVGDAVQRTGPLPFSEGVWEYMETIGMKQEWLREDPLQTYQKGDVVLLGKRKFRPFSAQDPEAYVVHWLRGSWKNKATEEPA